MWLSIIILSLFSAILGYVAYAYLNFYPHIIAKQIWTNFITLYPHTLSKNATPTSFYLPQYFSPSKIFCVISFAIISFVISWLSQNNYQNIMLLVWLNAYFGLLWLLCLFDLRYRLIPIELCYLLFILSISAVIYHLLDRDIIVSLYHAFLGFITFYIISLIAKYIYQKEALGMGDCWLMLGLCSLLSLIQIPWLILIASLLGIICTLIARYLGKHLTQIPFVPFLALAQTFLLLESVLY